MEWDWKTMMVRMSAFWTAKSRVIHLGFETETEKEDWKLHLRVSHWLQEWWEAAMEPDWALATVMWRVRRMGHHCCWVCHWDCPMRMVPWTVDAMGCGKGLMMGPDWVCGWAERKQHCWDSDWD